MLLIVLCLVFFFFFNFCAVGALCMLSYISCVSVTEWPPIGKIAVHSAYNMFSRNKYLIVNLVFPIYSSVFGVGIFF